jgi:hypothetical protein
MRISSFVMPDPVGLASFWGIWISIQGRPIQRICISIQIRIRIHFNQM